MASHDGDPGDMQPPSYEEALTLPKVVSDNDSVHLDGVWSMADHPPPAIPSDLRLAPRLAPELRSQVEEDSSDTANLIYPLQRRCSLLSKSCRITLAVLVAITLIVPLTYFGVYAFHRPPRPDDVIDYLPTLPQDTSSTPFVHPVESKDNLPHYVRSCLNSEGCWLQYEFNTDAYTECLGTRFVNWNSNIRLFVGVILCNRWSRYQIVLGETLRGMFLNIGAEGGDGTSHCNFVGTPMKLWSRPQLPRNQTSMKYGYVTDWSGAVRSGIIGGKAPYFGSYVCGTEFPGNRYFIKTSESCDIHNEYHQGRHQMATAWNGHANYSDPLYQCQTTSVQEYEIHVIAMYKSIFNNVPVRIELTRTSGSNQIQPLKLILMAYESFEWVIQDKNVTDPVDIDSVAVVSVHDNNVRFRSTTPAPVSSYTGNYGYGKSTSGTNRLRHFIESTFGPITTFHGIYEAADWSLRV